MTTQSENQILIENDKNMQYNYDQIMHSKIKPGYYPSFDSVINREIEKKLDYIYDFMLKGSKELRVLGRYRNGARIFFVIFALLGIFISPVFWIAVAGVTFIDFCVFVPRWLEIDQRYYELKEIFGEKMIDRVLEEIVKEKK